jgi:hypothetical protein
MALILHILVSTVEELNSNTVYLGCGVMKVSDMNEQGLIRRSVIWALISLIVVATLGVVCGLQYQTYLDENRELAVGIHRLDRLLLKTRVAGGPPEKLAQARKDVDERLSKLRIQLPPTLGEEAYLNHVASLAVSAGVKVKDSQVEVLSFDFYDQAHLGMKIVGREKSVNRLIKTLDKEQRLIRYEMSPHSKTEFDLDLWVFSVVAEEREKMIKDVALFMEQMTRCSKQKSDVWLWPLKKQIQQKRLELDTLCEKQKKYTDSIRSLMILGKKQHFAKVKEEVVKQLKEADVSSFRK